MFRMYEVLRPLPAHPVSPPRTRRTGLVTTTAPLPSPSHLVLSAHCLALMRPPIVFSHPPIVHLLSHDASTPRVAEEDDSTSTYCLTCCRRRRQHKHGLCRTQSQCTNKRRVPGHQGLGPRAVKKVRRVLVPLPCVSSVPLPYVSSGCLFLCYTRTS